MASIALLQPTPLVPSQICLQSFSSRLVSCVCTQWHSAGKPPGSLLWYKICLFPLYPLVSMDTRQFCVIPSPSAHGSDFHHLEPIQKCDCSTGSAKWAVFPCQRAFQQSYYSSPRRFACARMTLGFLLPADCFCDGVQREHPRRGAEGASAQHGLQPKCTLSPTLLRHTESFGLKGEFSAEAVIYPEQCRWRMGLFFPFISLSFHPAFIVLCRTNFQEMGSRDG